MIFGVREIDTDMDYKRLLKFCNLPTFERHLFFVLFFFDKGKAKKKKVLYTAMFISQRLRRYCLPFYANFNFWY